jgi:deoxycytidine triphosphate deaminase
VDGIARADSVIADGHKWLNVPYENGFAFVRDRSLLSHAFGIHAAYLPPPDPDRDSFATLGPESSRRARSLTVWATLRAYGRQGCQEVVERCLDLAQRVSARVDAEPDLERLAETTLNIVCFRDRPSGTTLNEQELDFWEPVRGEHGGVVLEPEDFYLLLSAESVRIPPAVASEMTAYDPTSGELRTHYAGFFDPGFGHAPEGGTVGSRAALEVRAHDVPFLVEHGQPVCKLVFERMAEVPDRLYGWDLGSSYQDQAVTLGKHFLRPTGTSSRQLRLLNRPPDADPDEASDRDQEVTIIEP